MTTTPPAVGADGAATAAERSFGARGHAGYALGLLAVINFFNYFDRNMLTILAEEIKGDLGLTDSQLGFLYGTAFSVLFAVVGIPMGRISDRVSRTKLLGGAVAVWSLMTMLSGAASTFLMLAVARIGVGLGEATANPCSNSLIADYYPQNKRASAMSVYLVGVFAGGAAALVVGGAIVQHWSTACSVIPLASACEVTGWQAAFYLSGLPGLFLAVLMMILREPPRTVAKTPSLVRVIIDEFSASTPPFTVWNAARLGGRRGVARNLALLALVAVAAALLALATGDSLQWGLVGFGVYAIGSWVQGVAQRDLPFYKLTFGCRTFVFTLAGMAITNIISSSAGFWAAPYALRNLGVSAASAGAMIGAVVVVGSILGVVLGGVLTDWWKKRDIRAPMWMALISLFGSAPFTLTMFITDSTAVFLAAYFVQALVSHIWAGGSAAFIQDMVIGRMRGAAAASYSLVIILVSLAVGPYWVGRIGAVTGGLTGGVLSIHLLLPIAALLLALAARRMRRETAEARILIARRAGEPI